MIYHVARSGDPNVVTVNADTAQDAARIAVIHRGFPNWAGVELRVQSTAHSYDQIVVVGELRAESAGAMA
jgi:hypothetical protein